MIILTAYLLLGTFPMSAQDAYLAMSELAMECGLLWTWAIIGSLRLVHASKGTV